MQKVDLAANPEYGLQTNAALFFPVLMHCIQDFFVCAKSLCPHTTDVRANFAFSYQKTPGYFAPSYISFGATTIIGD